MTISNVKAMVAKVLTVGVLAGAFVMASAPKAEAQGFSVGVRFGAPVYAPRYDDRFRREEFARHEAFVRQQEFLRHEERAHRYDRGHEFGHEFHDGYRR